MNATEQSAAALAGKPTQLSRALETIRKLRAQLDASQARQEIAIVGTGLRLPGGIDTLDSYWDALTAGRDLTVPIPAHRTGPFAAQWESLPKRGGFLDEVLGFDAAYFGISPREARALDPQHRLLLEVSSEALADAALPPGRLQVTPTGFYLGITHQDYRDWEPDEADAYWATGNGHSFAAGRIAYTMGLSGPAVAVDTACSSSLVAIHQAAAALRRGDCEVALAGGVNLILSPRSTRLLSREMGALAPDGTCKAFDARANGFTRGEGCAVLVLKPLDAALRDGDRVHAVLAGSAVNSDGRSSGFTAPNVLAQAALLRAALADAGLAPADIGLVEAHGTGTALGDPIEMEALAMSLGRPKGPADPLYVGTVKANIGHLEAAAGVAGVVKAILCLRHRAIPPVAHLRTVNPRIDLAGTGIVLPTGLAAWPDGAGRYAGVSSFGMSGTNAHVILAAPQLAGHATGQGGSPPEVTGFELSARTPAALCELAARYAGQLRVLPDDQYAAFAYTSTFGRPRQRCVASVAAGDRASASEALAALARDEPTAAVTITEGGGQASPEPGLTRQVTSLPNYPWQRERFAPLASEGETAPTAATRATGGQAAATPPPLYRLSWEPVPAAGGHPDGGTIVLAGDDSELLAALARAAGRAGKSAVVLPAVPATDADWHGWWAGQAPRDCACLVLAMAARPLPDVLPAGGLDGLDGGPQDGSAGIVGHAAALCAAVTRAARSVPREAPARVVALTRASRRVTGEDRVLASDHGLLNGLAPGIGLELPGWGAVIDLTETVTAADASAVIAALTVVATEDTLAVRGGAVLGARLSAAPVGYQPGLPVAPDASYLITGGLGGVGRAICADLVCRGARHLLITGRRFEGDLPDAAAGLLGRFRAEGVSVRYRAVDCDDPTALACLLAECPDAPPLRGVVHAAGTLSGTPATSTGAGEFAEAARGKLTGAWWLHLLLRDQPLDFFVLVSSVSALWGMDGYSAYAAANGGLDMIAAHRNTAGLRAVSIAYGPWAVGGMVGESDLAMLSRVGVDGLDPAAGCDALTAQGPGGESYLACCPVRWPRFAAVMAARRSRALYRALTVGEDGVPGDGVPGDGDPDNTGTRRASGSPAAREALLSLPELARPAAAREAIAASTAAILGFPDRRSVPDDQGLFDLGMDSMMAADLVAELTSAYAVPLHIAEVFDHPTVADLAALVTARCSGSLAEPAPPPGPQPRPASAPLPAAAPLSTPAPPPAPAPLITQGPPPAADQCPVPEPAPGPGSQAGTGEPIAIVGMAGRFPGADSVAELWQLLRYGRDGVGPVPPDRWDAAMHSADPTPADPILAGTITTDQGGFLSDITSFDAAFFGIPAREAQSLDPQHRLLLEAAWHALEDAAIDPRRLRGTRTGVFVGISNSDYARLLEVGGPDGIDAYFGTGTSLNAAAGRVAYLLDLHGPAMAIDTACSSSLVAVHLAIRSLRSGEIETALVGGVNVIASPEASVAVSRAHMLSAAGRCKTFAADADGFVRSEAVAVLVLKPLSAAVRDGDHVHAVLYGSAVNSDGASTGLTAPSGRAQQAVIASALADAGVPGPAISYLEAHGTGTALGDPVEVGAAWQVLGPGRRPGEPLYLGSVKSNVGHCESASGMVSLAKTVLALRHDVLPADLHCAELNPRIDWRDMNVWVVDTAVPWRPADGPRLAGVSGFGFSGTNAHVIIGDPPTPVTAPDAAAPDAAPSGPGPWLLPLSAADDEGLARVSLAWDEALSTAADAGLPAFCAVAGTGRAHLPARRALLGGSAADLRRDLGRPPRRRGRTAAPRVAFLFSGQGSQYFGMGRALHETEPAFREMFDTCAEILAPHIGGGLGELIWHGTDQELINQTWLTQPALVALELSLAALWESWGVTASAVIGHSVGEVAAAIYAGVITLPDGLALIAHRGRLMQDTEPGAMLSVSAPAGQVTGWLDGTGLDLAAINGPRATVVAGRAAAIEAFAAARKADGLKVHRLTASRAFHSRLMDPAVAGLRQAIGSVTFRSPRLPIVANVTGSVAAAGDYDAAYWCRHLREPVWFSDGVQQLHSLGADAFLEIGPGRTLAGLVKAAGHEPAGGVLTSLGRGSGDKAVLLEAVRDLYELGQDVRWGTVQPLRRDATAGAPHYPFARTRHWTTVTGPTAAAPTAVAAAGTGLPALVPHWGRELRSAALTARVFEFPRSARFPAYLTDHRLYGTVVTPAASHLGTIVSALRPAGPLVIRDMVCPRALVITEDERYDVQLTVDEGSQRLRVQSLVDVERGTWQEHMAGHLVPGGEQGAPRLPDRDAFIAAAGRHMSGEAFYAYFRRLGYTLGPAFRWIADVWIAGEESLVRYAPPPLPDDPADYQVYPGLIDSLFQSIAGFLVDEEAAEAESLAIPFAAAAVSFSGRATSGDTELWGHVRVRAARPLPRGRSQVEAADLSMFTAAGDAVFWVEDFRVRHAPRALLQESLRGGNVRLLAPGWEPLPASPPDEAVPNKTKAGRYAIRLRGAGGGALAGGLAAALAGLGSQVHEDPPAPADMIIDLNYAGPAGTRDAADARDAVLGLAEALRDSPADVPYVVVCADDAACAPAREAIWGMLAALEAEDPRRCLVRVQAEADMDPARLARVLTQGLAQGFPETRLRLAEGEAFGARLRPEQESAPAASGAWPEVALVTGGLGALGLAVARMLAARGTREITLMGRTAPDATARRVIGELAGQGTHVTLHLGDVGGAEDCAAALAAASARGPLQAVFHLAGTTADGAFPALAPAAFEEVFAAKAAGAEHLALAAGGDLTAFVLFSSVASVLGSAGQANYAAANGYLNGLAMTLRSRGVPATAVAWGPWEPADRAGLAASAAARQAAARAGMRSLTDDEAGLLLAAAVTATAARLVAAAIDVPRYVAAAGPRRAALLAPLAQGLPPQTQNAPGETPPGWLRDELASLDPVAREDRLRDVLRVMMGDILGAAALVEEDRGFAELGLDSIMAIDLSVRLSHGLGTQLPATVALDHPTVTAMAAHLGAVANADAVGDADATPAVAPGEAVPSPDAVPLKNPVLERPALERPDLDDPADLSLADLVGAVREDLAAGF